MKLATHPSNGGSQILDRQYSQPPLFPLASFQHLEVSSILLLEVNIKILDFLLYFVIIKTVPGRYSLRMRCHSKLLPLGRAKFFFSPSLFFFLF